MTSSDHSNADDTFKDILCGIQRLLHRGTLLRKCLNCSAFSLLIKVSMFQFNSEWAGRPWEEKAKEVLAKSVFMSNITQRTVDMKAFWQIRSGELCP